MEIVKGLIKPSAVMFDHIQKSNLIGFFTNLDFFLNKLIPMLCVYFDQTLQCSQKQQNFNKKPAQLREEKEITEIQRSFDSTFEMANNILKELKRINSTSNEGGDEEPKVEPKEKKEQMTKEEFERQFKGYRQMNAKEKAKLLIDLNEVKYIEKMLAQRQALAKQKGMPPDPQLFKPVYYRIYHILKQNFLHEFY